MEVSSVVQALLSLIFVLGLMLLMLWGMKYLQLKSGRSRFLKKLQREERIIILERKRLDAKTILLLLRKDDKEYLLLAGVGGNVLLDSCTVKEDKGAENAGGNV